MALKTNLSDEQLAEAATRIRSGETWKTVASDYRVDRCDLCRHFRLAGLDYRRRFYKCRARALDVPVSATDLAYMAGLFDGEGHLGLQADRYSVQITNTCYDVMTWLLQFGGAVRTRPRPDPKHRTCYNWGVFAQQDVQALLEALLPYLIIKREICIHAMEMIGRRPYRVH